MRRDNASAYLNSLMPLPADRLKRVKPRWSGYITLALLGTLMRTGSRPPPMLKPNPSLRAAFGAFGFRPPGTAYHFRLWQAPLAEAYFVASRPRGGTMRWDSRWLLSLLADYTALKKRKTLMCGPTKRYARS